MRGKIEVDPSRSLEICRLGLSPLGDRALSTAHGEDLSYHFHAAAS
jgi:hypothetical protein